MSSVLAEGNNETLDNIIALTEAQEAAMAYYYTNDAGETVAYSVSGALEGGTLK